MKVNASSRKLSHFFSTGRSTFALLVSALLSLCLSQGAWALPDDNQQDIIIKSKRFKQQVLTKGEKTEYFGDVVMSQGSMQIVGDHVIIHSLDHQATRIIAVGKPATFQQQSAGDQAPVIAKGNKIVYQLEAQTLVLTGSASIEQQGSNVSGKRILYNINTEQVQASGGNSGEKVVMVFEPVTSKDSSPLDDAANTTDDIDETGIAIDDAEMDDGAGSPATEAAPLPDTDQAKAEPSNPSQAASQP